MDDLVASFSNRKPFITHKESPYRQSLECILVYFGKIDVLIVFAEKVSQDSHLDCALDHVVAKQRLEPPEVVVPFKLAGLFGIPANLMQLAEWLARQAEILQEKKAFMNTVDVYDVRHNFSAYYWLSGFFITPLGSYLAA
jgi:hypothetical protein